MRMGDAFHFFVARTDAGSIRKRKEERRLEQKSRTTTTTTTVKMMLMMSMSSMNNKTKKATTGTTVETVMMMSSVMGGNSWESNNWRSNSYSESTSDAETDSESDVEIVSTSNKKSDGAEDKMSAVAKRKTATAEGNGTNKRRKTENAPEKLEQPGFRFERVNAHTFKLHLDVKRVKCEIPMGLTKHRVGKSQWTDAAPEGTLGVHLNESLDCFCWNCDYAHSIAQKSPVFISRDESTPRGAPLTSTPRIAVLKAMTPGKDAHYAVEHETTVVSPVVLLFPLKHENLGNTVLTTTLDGFPAAKWSLEFSERKYTIKALEAGREESE